MQISGNIVDVVNQRIFSGTLESDGERITAVHEGACDAGRYILPGLIDAHVHIESSMLVPYEFSRLASVHGTIATVSDPHEIANVLGRSGIDFMVDNSRENPFRFFFGVPSCVPATPFETAGGSIAPADVAELIGKKDFLYLSEMMNVPGVLSNNPQVMEKIRLTLEAGKKVDGHCPTLSGQNLETYIQAGISTDHECTTLAEAEEKIRLGMKILIREGSAARDFAALFPLLDRYPGMCMFCSDDLHPDNLVQGHINLLVKRALQNGCNLFSTLRAATLTPVEHYGLDCGLLRPGDYADYLVVDNLEDFHILSTTIRGQLVAQQGRSLLTHRRFSPINLFSPRHCIPEDFQIAASTGLAHVIVAEDGKLLTRREQVQPAIIDGHIVADPTRDILKIAVINRYDQDAPVSLGLIRNFGIKRGAMASSVAHDSHNSIAVGCDDHSLAQAVNLLQTEGGGLAVVDTGKNLTLPLPFAGLMSDDDGYKLADRYHEMDALLKTMGTTLSAPFMTLSFMALLVIPSLKLSDQGLFDSETFSFLPLQGLH